MKTRASLLVLYFFTGIYVATTVAQTNTFPSSGNVGIGTSNPTALLDVWESGNTNLVAKFRSGESADRINLEIIPGGTSNLYWYAHRWGHNWHWERNSSSGRVRQMRLLTNGNLQLYHLTIGMNDIGIQLHPKGNSYFAGGKVGIGTKDPTSILAVNGTTKTKEIIVTDQSSDWPDYVFTDKGYRLPEIGELEAFIEDHKHLPGIPTADEIAKEGEIG